MMVQKNWANKDQGKAFDGASVSPYSFSIQERMLLMEALDHIFVSRQYQDVGSCALCRKISIKKCSSCGTHYCSSECQAYDWPKHKAFCTRNTDNASERSGFSSKRQMVTSSPVQNSNKDVFCKERLLLSGRNSPFASLANTLSKESANKFSGSKSLANFKFTNKQSRLKSSGVNSSTIVNKKPNYGNEPKTTSTPKKSMIHSSNQESSFQESPTESKASGDLNLSAGHKTVDTMIEMNGVQDELWDSTLINAGGKVNNHPKPVSMSLPKIWNKNVIGMYRESPNRYWVMDMNSVVKYEEIQVTLTEECEKYDYIIPTIGLLCGCKYANEWYRARVLSLVPELTVHFVDYGNTSVYTSDLVKELPEKLKSIPPLAFLIQFDESTPSSFETNDLDSLKFTIQETKRTVDGICCVKIISGPTGAMAKITRNKSPLSEPANNVRSVMDTLTKTSSGLIFLAPGKSEIRYGAIVPDENEEAKESLKNVWHIKSLKLTPVGAKNGELVMVMDKEGYDQRGKVLSKLGNIYYVQLIDCGNIITTDKVYCLANDLKDLIGLGVKITIKEVFIKGMIEVAESCYFNITDEPEPGVWSCTLKNATDDVIVRVNLEKPIENTVQKPTSTYFRPKSGSAVEIICFTKPNTFYVRVIDAEAEQKFLEMNMEMAEIATRAKSLPIPPPVGEICCARFLEDGRFYRAIVTSVQSRTITVLFVDFGNEQDTDLKDMKPLPERLKIIPFFASKVHLKGFTDTCWNDSVMQYLTTLITDNKELILIYNGSMSDGVILQEKATGRLVNKFIEDAQKNKKGKPPSVKDTFLKSEIFLDEDIQYTIVPVGKVCRLAVLHISEAEFESNHFFWATDADNENFNFVNSELSIQISEYCHANLTPYKPSFRELCLAEFEGFWYRAMSVGDEGEFFKIFFLDFGNVCKIKASSIRKIKKELLSAPAMAMNCTIVDPERLKGNPEMMKKVYEALFERLNSIIEGVRIGGTEGETYFLDIPEVEAILSG